jgi:hypothetical protein
MGLFDSLFRKKSEPLHEVRSAPLDKNRFLIRLSESEHTDFGRVDFDEQPFDQRVFSAAWALEGTVNMDGFATYLEYDSDSSYFAVEALNAVGAPNAATIVRKALEVVAGHPKDHGRVHVDQADLSPSEQKALEELQQEFYSYPDSLTDLLFAFVAARPESFGPVPDLE